MFYDSALKEDEKSGIIYRQWTLPSPKAVLLLVHGLYAHSGRWQFLGDFLLDRGISSYALELKGFGKTKDLPGHLDSFDIYFNDILRLCDISRQKIPDKTDSFDALRLLRISLNNKLRCSKFSEGIPL